MRVGIEFAFRDQGWLGGVHAIAYLLRALATLPHRRIEPVIVAAPNTPQAFFDDLPQFEVLRTALVAHGGLLHSGRRILRRAIGLDMLMENWLKRKNIVALSHCESLGANSSIAAIGHIADFSYKYFKDYYAPNVFARKDAGIARICDEYDTLLLSSRAVATDYRHFFPSARAKEAVLHMIPSQPSNRKSPNWRTLHERYGVQEPFFYVPNQFWMHKNHRVIVDALALLAAEGWGARVVSTGLKRDDRQPDYFNELMRHVSAKGVGDRFQILGLIPFEDTIGLMRRSIAVLQTSLFEGWGLTVTEAKMMGKTIILSDIPVFREQAPEYAYFFNPKDPEELAAYMGRVIDEYSLREDLRRQDMAEKNRLQTITNYALAYEEIVIETVARKKQVRPNGR